MIIHLLRRQGFLYIILQNELPFEKSMEIVQVSFFNLNEKKIITNWFHLKRKSLIKKEATSKKEAGVDAEHVFIFIWP